jgi:hypothetical protein
VKHCRHSYGGKNPPRMQVRSSPGVTLVFPTSSALPYHHDFPSIGD